MPTLSHVTQHDSTTAPPPLLWSSWPLLSKCSRIGGQGHSYSPSSAANLSVPCFTLPQFLYLQSEISDEYSMDRDEVLPLKPHELLAAKTPLNPPLEEKHYTLWWAMASGSKERRMTPMQQNKLIQTMSIFQTLQALLSWSFPESLLNTNNSIWLNRENLYYLVFYIQQLKK